MISELSAIVTGLAVLLWSADRFVDGAASIARHLGMPPLLIGMVVVGFGTSAPEMVVSAFSAVEGNPGIALGNAYGSNIANIALVLGITAVLAPIGVHSRILRVELPIQVAVIGLAALQISDGFLSRNEAFVLLGAFALLMAWTVFEGSRRKRDSLASEMTYELDTEGMTLGRAVVWFLVGLGLLIASSRLLIWGAVEIATMVGVSDLIIGLTIVALGTSLPELAASIIAIRKGENDLALGNVLGSNLFNTLLVVGVAGMIRPFGFGPEVLSRDVLTMGVLAAALFVFGFGFRKGRTGRINRFEGAALLGVYVTYSYVLLRTTLLS